MHCTSTYRLYSIFCAALRASFFGYGVPAGATHTPRKVSKKHSLRGAEPPLPSAFGPQQGNSDWQHECREDTTRARQVRRSYSVASLRSLGGPGDSSLRGSVNSLVDLVDTDHEDAASVAALSVGGSSTAGSVSSGHHRGVQRSQSRERCLTPRARARRSQSTAVSPGSVRNSAPDFAAAVEEAASHAEQPLKASPVRRASTTTAADVASNESRESRASSGWWADRIRGAMASSTSEAHRAKTQSVRARLVSTFKAPYSHGIGESIERWNSQERLSLEQSVAPIGAQQDENLLPDAASFGADGGGAVQLNVVRRRRRALADLGFSASVPVDGAMGTSELEVAPDFDVDIVDPNRSALSLGADSMHSMPGAMSDAPAFDASFLPSYEYSAVSASAYEYYSPYDAADSISFTDAGGGGAPWPQQQEYPADELVSPAAAAAAGSQEIKRSSSKLSLKGLVHKV